MQAERHYILGIPIDAYTWDSWLDQIGEWVAHPDGRLHHICTVNPEFVMIAQADSAFRAVLQAADICTADGVGLLWAARRIGFHLPGRVTGSDGVPKIAGRASQVGWRLFLLGAAPGIAEKTAHILTTRYPGLQIAGHDAGDPSPQSASAILERIHASHADILLVAYGAPQQDVWIETYREQLQVKVAMGVGGAFDFIAGLVPRAPRWMRRLGLEWLFRLIRQPWRWRRMLRLPRFVWAVWRYGEQLTPSARQASGQNKP